MFFGSRFVSMRFLVGVVVGFVVMGCKDKALDTTSVTTSGPSAPSVETTAQPQTRADPVKVKSAEAIHISKIDLKNELNNVSEEETLSTDEMEDIIDFTDLPLPEVKGVDLPAIDFSGSTTEAPTEVSVLASADAESKPVMEESASEGPVPAVHAETTTTTTMKPEFHFKPVFVDWSDIRAILALPSAVTVSVTDALNCVPPGGSVMIGGVRTQLRQSKETTAVYAIAGNKKYILRVGRRSLLIQKWLSQNSPQLRPFLLEIAEIQFPVDSEICQSGEFFFEQFTGLRVFGNLELDDKPTVGLIHSALKMFRLMHSSGVVHHGLKHSLVWATKGNIEDGIKIRDFQNAGMFVAGVDEKRLEVRERLDDLRQLGAIIGKVGNRTIQNIGEIEIFYREMNNAVPDLNFYIDDWITQLSEMERGM